jgi:glucokinase
MQEVLAIDIGGTHARFAVAQVLDGKIVELVHERTLKTAEHVSLHSAWEHYCADLGRRPPREAGVAVAGPVGGQVLKLTNNPWVIRVDSLADQLGLERLTLLNDFAAIAHAVAAAPAEARRHVCGPAAPLPEEGAISVLGPGTGLGAAIVLRGPDGAVRVQATEGGHMSFAPQDSLEDAILRYMRKHYSRVSVERVVSGPGLVHIYHALGELEGSSMQAVSDTALWTRALERPGEDALTDAAFDRFCLCLGAVAGDLALAQGAKAVVLAGGVTRRIGERLAHSGFAERFAAKGRFESLMQSLPVQTITLPEPGLFGAAAAHLAEHPA